MKLPRVSGWPRLLDEYLRACALTPFAWGRHDCWTFGFDGVEIVTKHNYMADVRGSYDTALGAARILQENGGMLAMLVHRLGIPLANPAMAQRGDLVLFDTGCHGQALALCMGPHLAAVGRDGVVYAPMNAATTAWRV